MNLTTQERAIGCMLGVHYGDSLGVGVEFLPIYDILSNWPGGVDVCQPAFNLPAGVYSDDTQMTISVAKGILATPEKDPNSVHILGEKVWEEFITWGELIKDLKHDRGSGSTCRNAVKGPMGLLSAPQNDSAGCGTVMRTAPVGIAYHDVPTWAFKMGQYIGAMTHGHPDGYVPAGAQSMLIALLMNGKPLQESLREVDEEILAEYNRWSKSRGKTHDSFLVATVTSTAHPDHAKFIDENFAIPGHLPGGGWLGHHALAIAVYAARCAPDDPIKAIKIAVNHSGDSDTTGAICGAIMGALHGPAAIEAELQRTGITLEAHDEMVSLAKALAAKYEYDPE